MARPKRQARRRAELVEATQRVITKHGLDGARINRIAEETGLTSGTVLYYFPNVEDLILEALRAAMERFYEARVQKLSELPDIPSLRLVRLMKDGLPTGPEDTVVRMLCELGGSAGRYPVVAALLTTLYDREVSIYEVVLAQGVAKHEFTLSHDATVIARNLVALENAYGYRIMAGHPVIDHDQSFRFLLDYARAATGHELSD